MVRHGCTPGNLEKRYIGVTDEALHEDGIRLLYNKKKNMPILPTEIYVSPRIRCRQTAEILFPNVNQIVVEDFAECNFGLFENKNYEELSKHPAYKKFLASGGESGFPEGETKAEFASRTCQAFCTLIHSVYGKKDAVVLVVHGGTIMAILERYGVPEKPFYEWHIGNGEGYLGELIKLPDGSIRIEDLELYV